MKICLSFLAFAAVFYLTGCGNDNSSGGGSSGGSSSAAPSGPAGTEAGAKELLTAFLKEGADTKTLTAALRPEKADYEAVFTAEFAEKLAATHEPMWDGGAAIGPKSGQTELLLHGVPSAEIRTWSENARMNLPGGYEKIKDSIREGLTVYAFKFVEPGESLGMAFDGLVHVNGKWRLFPKPFRAAD